MLEARIQNSSAITMPDQCLSRNRRQKSVLASFIPSPSSLFLTIFFIISLLMNGGFQPLTKRGFFCSDTTIRYPVKTDTVSFKVLLVVALVIPSIVISLLERRLLRSIKSNNHRLSMRIRKNSDRPENETEEVEELIHSNTQIKKRIAINRGESDLDSDDEIKKVSLGCDTNSNQEDSESLSRSVISTTQPHDDATASVAFAGPPKAQPHSRKFSDLQLFLFGFVATSFLTGVGKTTSGRLRPHFMDRCKPDIDCSSPANLNRYIVDFTCTAEIMRPRDYSYITTSFPSGHASIVFFSMIYLTVYLNLILSVMKQIAPPRSPKFDINPLMTCVMYVLMISLATYISLTRVSDYHHHPTDVLSGAFLGTIIAIVMSKYLVYPRFSSLKKYRIAATG